MAGERFDIIFCGELMTGTDPEVARGRLKQRFGLTDQALERLFQGRPVSIKRGVDAATATNYRTLFQEAGALVRIDPVQDVPEVPIADRQSRPPAADREPAAPEQGALGFSTDTGYLEVLPEQTPPDLDLSALSLVTDEDWSLEDCAPPPSSLPLPDISHLSIVEEQT